MIIPKSAEIAHELEGLQRENAAYEYEWVDTRGNVEYAQRFRGQFASPLDLRRFPFDAQQLEIRFISYRYGPEEVALAANRVLRSEVFSIAGWRIGEPGCPQAERKGERLHSGTDLTRRGRA